MQLIICYKTCRIIKILFCDANGLIRNRSDPTSKLPDFTGWFQLSYDRTHFVERKTFPPAPTRQG